MLCWMNCRFTRLRSSGMTQLDIGSISSFPRSILSETTRLTTFFSSAEIEMLDVLESGTSSLSTYPQVSSNSLILTQRRRQRHQRR